MNEENNKKTEEMIRYEKETGKYAIWRGYITEGFKKWQSEGSIKSFKKNKQYYGTYRTNIYIPEEIKKEWYDQAKKFGYISFSKFLIDSVRYFIERNEQFSDSINNEVQEISRKKMEIDIFDIDDDIETLRLFGDYFTSQGFSFKGVINGTAGLDYLEFIKPKIILLDIILPDINGYDIFKKIRKMSGFKDTPIYFVTAIPESEVNKMVKNMNLDPVGILYLPFKRKDLDKIITIIKI